MQTSILIDHYKYPRHKGVVDNPDVCCEVHNRKCGDQLSFTARVQNDILQDVRFEGKGCFYCLASASIVCNHMTGKRTEQILRETVATRNWLANKLPKIPDLIAGDEEIRALGEVKNYAMRIGCVDLAWEGIEKMLHRE